MEQTYASVPAHQALLSYASQASCNLQEAYSEEEMKTKTMEINMAFFHYVVELLLAYALTYEDHECSCGNQDEEFSYIPQENIESATIN